MFSEKGKEEKKITPSHFDIRKTQHALLLLTVVLCMEKTYKKRKSKKKKKIRCGTKLLFVCLWCSRI